MDRWSGLCLIIIVLMFIYGIIMTTCNPTPLPTTPHTNCPLVDKIHDQEMRRNLDKIDEQGQIIATYEFRYRGLHKLGEGP